MSNRVKNIYNIPAGQPFAKLLAQSLLEETKDQPESLSQILVLLPTRRACRVLQDAFVNLRPENALILPRMQPIGDLDEEELSLSILGQNNAQDSWSLRPAISPLKREILLSTLIQKAHSSYTQDQALMLARTLGRLIDQIYTENLDMADLVSLVPEEFAQHWQITLQFLEILSAHWPSILDEYGMMDLADRRNQLILKLAEHWQGNPPQNPVIGAGSTGSIPSTAQLLSVIAGLPQGRIILPGLDTDGDEETWNTLSETHPQFGLRMLLNAMDTKRQDVQPFINEGAQNINREILAREIMRPAETTGQWVNLQSDKQARQHIQNSLEGLSLIICEDGHEEAQTIAVMMRETLETPDKTACLITPDRNLAARVAAACQRWDITIDDSAGQSLKHTGRGIFMRLVIKSIAKDLSPIALLSVLKHSRFAHKHVSDDDIDALDYALRGRKPAKNFDGLIQHIEKQDRLDTHIKERTLAVLKTLAPAFKPLCTFKNKSTNFAQFLKEHLELCEALSDTKKLWCGDDGRNASAFFAGLFEHANDIGPVSLEEYASTLEHFMDQVQIRPSFGTHPRLQILGQLEARLIDADLVIMGGLNEGVWPAEPSADPWMSRPMRKSFGLPSAERSIGLSAHDFVQGLCTNNVVITRALREDGAPSVPSRWLQRLDTVLKAAQLEPIDKQQSHAQHWARALDHSDAFEPLTAPQPKPPVEARPKRLSVTQIETWLRDPYAIYARHILGLKMLDPLEKPLDAAARGTILHAVLERFVIETKDLWPNDPEKLIIKLAKDQVKANEPDPQSWSFWWPRFAKTAQWLSAHEHAWREETRNSGTEIRGEMQISTDSGNFTLSAIADRIDTYKDGQAAIIDYKSGGSFSKSGMNDGKHPQLPLEALMLAHGAFTGIAAAQTASLQYWVLSGAGGGKITALDQDLDTLINETRNNLNALITAYNDADMPYLSIPNAAHAPRFNDYEHLARIQEWSVLGDEAESEAA